MARFNPDLNNLVRLPVQSPIVPGKTPPPHGGEPGINPFLRSTLPLSFMLQSDVLRQFYQPGIPQFRVTPPLQNGIRKII